MVKFSSLHQHLPIGLIGHQSPSAAGRRCYLSPTQDVQVCAHIGRNIDYSYLCCRQGGTGQKPIKIVPLWGNHYARPQLRAGLRGRCGDLIDRFLTTPSDATVKWPGRPSTPFHDFRRCLVTTMPIRHKCHYCASLTLLRQLKRGRDQVCLANV